jgi:hypothetical protein
LLGKHSIAGDQAVSKSLFEKKACNAERDSELRRMNEALRESRLIWQARMDQELLPENQAKARSE